MGSLQYTRATNFCASVIGYNRTEITSGKTSVCNYCLTFKSMYGRHCPVL